MATSKISPEAKEGLSDAEVKAAEKNPAGDTEHSGAAPGAKGGDPSDVTPFKVPVATEKAQKKADERADTVREIQTDIALRALTNVPAEAVTTVYATPKAGSEDKPESVSFAQVGSVVHFVATAKELEFDREAALGLVRAMNAFSASL